MSHVIRCAAGRAMYLPLLIAVAAAAAGCASGRDRDAGTRAVPYENPFAAMSPAEREVALDLEALSVSLVLETRNPSDPEAVGAWPGPRASPSGTTGSPRGASRPV